VTYQILPAREYLNTARCPTCTTRWISSFAFGLDRILDGLGISHDFPRSRSLLISLVGNPQPTMGRQLCRCESELEHCARGRQEDFALCGGICGSTP
jgi:hypothetical protein